MGYQTLQKALRELADPAIAEHSARFFKTGKGQYAAGDVFLGVRVSPIRALAKQYSTMPLKDTLKILSSKFHEERLLAVFLMVNSFARADKTLKQEIYTAYLENTHLINNWDLVDSSAHQIVGGYLMDKNRKPLKALSQSTIMWERRIAIIATLHFIRERQFADTLQLAKILLNDSEDLIHKAVGWMLREVGNRDSETLKIFLKEHQRVMPRTMLRYAIEKFDPATRQTYLKGIA
ncbi:DNA alkylation repair protein [Granulosicoccus sp.]|nr:DNA alkylation repair protein [Granulosicoccus sp.]MDB4224822.1 DNA alkylation repair protein [Granulosicoccus sp.]